MISRYSLTNVNLFLLLAILTLGTATTLGQTTAARPDRGTMPHGSYAVSDIESISLQNGNVNLNIPLASLPPIAGGKLSWTLNAQYNSKIWDVARTQLIGPASFNQTYVVDSVQQSDRGGWRITGQYQLQIRNAHMDFDYQMPPVSDQDYSLMVNNSWYTAVLVMPDGAEHELRPLDYSPFPGSKSFLIGTYSQTPYTHGTMRYYSYDGSYLYATVTAENNWTVYLRDGTRIIQTPGIQRIQDTNGNKIKSFSDSTGTHYQDEQTGREIRYFYDPAANNGKGQGQVWYQAVGGTWMHIDINFRTTSVEGQLYTVNDWEPGASQSCTHQAPLSEEVPVVDEIVLPQTEPGQPNRRFTFSYNSDTAESVTDLVHFTCSEPLASYTRQASKGWGSLSKIVTPSGAEVQYTYQFDVLHLLFNPDSIAGQTITKKTIVQDGPDDIWTYSITLNGGSQTYLADNSTIAETKYPQAAQTGTGYGGSIFGLSGLVYRTTGPFSKTERHWTNLIFTGASTVSPGGSLAFNAVVDAEYTTLTDASGNALKMSATTFQYDYNGNVLQSTEYDWFAPGLVTRDAKGIPTGVPASATVLRVTNNSYYNAATSASSANVYAKRSAATGTPLILNAPQQTTLGPSIVQLSYDGQAYNVAPTVGNLTTRKVWDDLDSKWITTSNTYDVYGNIATSTDGRGKVTQFFYDDATHAVPNRVVVDPQNSTGTQTTTTAFDYYTGLLTSQTDMNGQVSTIDYTNQQLGTVDPFGRPGVTKAPQININGANHQRRTTTNYLDATRQLIVATDLNAENDQLLKTRTTTDQLGRPVLTEQTEDGTNYTIAVNNRYLDMGRVTLTSSAMRSTAASTDGWTRVTKDGADRVIEVATFGGAAQPAWSGTTGVYTGAITTAYDANFTTMTDQAGKLRRSMADGVGRLQRVDEPDASNSLGSTVSPAQPTAYTYDVLDNLTTVTQGSQTRTFTYDSLSRLRTAINPESGTNTYQYDDNANLLVKTDARGVSAHYSYDSLNRATRRWYNSSNLTSATTHNNPVLPASVGATDEVKFYYDSQALPAGAPSYSRGSAVGRLVAQTYGSGSNGDYYAYDVLGRATLKIQQTGTVNYQLSATYNLPGAIKTLTYPSNHTVTNSFDQAGRLTAFSGDLGGAARTYASGILYSPTGGLVKEQFGTTTPVYNKRFYNSRSQLAEIRVSTSYTGPTDYDSNRGAIVNSYSDQCTGICSGSSMTDNNGNLKKQEIYIPSQQMRWQQYDYDSVNRLLSVREVLDGGTEQWKQQFTYDRWGNRTINTAVTYGIGINNKAFSVNTTNNQLGVPAGQPATMTYDVAGNLMNDTYTGAGNRTYDAENKITSALGSNSQTQTYKYDASGQRIKRVVNGIETWQVHGFGGELLAEYPANGAVASPQKEYGYRNGQLLVTVDGNSSGGPPASGLAGYWKFDENSGVTAADSSGNNNTGTLTSGAFWAAGQSGAATSLDGVNDYVQVGAQTSLVMTSAASFSAWIYPTGPGSLAIDGGIIVSKEGEYEIGRFADGTIQWAFANTNPAWNWVNTGYVAPLNQWTHVTVTYSSGVIKTYINGALTHTYSGSGSIGDTSASQNDFRIGGRQVASQHFQGRLDEVRVYNRALSATEVTTLSASGPPASGLAGYWKFDENSGVTAADSSGNSNTGTLTSGAFWATGQSGAATSLDGVNDYVQVGAQTSLVMTSAASFSAWIYPTGPGSLAIDGGIIVSKEGEYEIGRFADGTIQWAFANTNPAWNWVNTGYVAPLNQWTHVTVTYSSGVIKTYINGALTHTYSGSGSIGDTSASQNDFRIGGRQVASQHFQGRLDEVRVYNRALSASEVTTLPNGAGPSSGAQISWLVSDQLGTPRMILDQTGSLANIKRHDYLPFGEELFAPAGGRSTSFGYTTGDGVRQQFTSKERDTETGLDYFLARYYSSSQGRFTSADPANPGGLPFDPQSWNGYAYARNSPVKYQDPDGKSFKICDLQGVCTSVSDDDAKRYTFNKEYQKNNEYYTQGDGKIYGTDGNVIGTYQNMGCDCWSDSQNRMVNGIADELGKPTTYLFGAAAAIARTKLRPAKPVNLPASRNVLVDMIEVASGHMQGGERALASAASGKGKSLFAQWMTPTQVESAIIDAYEHSNITQVQGVRVVLKGETKDGTIIEMWFNRETKIIETAYPVGKN